MVGTSNLGSYCMAIDSIYIPQFDCVAVEVTKSPVSRTIPLQRGEPNSGLYPMYIYIYINNNSNIYIYYWVLKHS